jgi:AraC-like DNA-binding protein
VERVVAWKPPVPGIREVFHAEFHEHAYPPHTHDAWTLCIVDRGAIEYDLDRHTRGGGSATVTLLPPHVVHDGRSARSSGYRKRVLYVETSVLGEELIGPAVDRSAINDPRLRRGIATLHELMREPDDALEAESRLALVAERLRRHLTRRAERQAPGDLAERLRAHLDEHAFERVTLADSAILVGASPAHLVRSFTHAFGLPPHAYQLARRVEAARVRLLEGEPIARVAAEVGFVDQAHFSRHFKRHVGTTPGRFAA